MKRFKRFSDTLVTDLPATARLCVIAGPNGCGKSSYFESLNFWSQDQRYNHELDSGYHVKSPELGSIPKSDVVKIAFHETLTAPRKAIYVRSAYRNDPDFYISSLTRLEPLLNENRTTKLIDNDASMSRNYQILASQALEDLFEREPATKTVGEFRDSVIGDIKKSVDELFPGLVLNSLGNPLSEGTFRFSKGTAKRFLYKNLSGGEKSAFDLLVDMIVKKRVYDDTVFCIDEPEAHMAPGIQGRLLEELFKVTGPKCQLWLATHSIGMMRRARDLSEQNPGEVIFLDFGDCDFDLPQVIVPQRPTRAFWQKIVDVALDDFAALVAPKQIVVCEGRRIGDGGRSEALDAKILDLIFGDEFPDTRFIPGGNSHEVENDRMGLVAAIRVLVKGATIWSVIDRDDASDIEIRDKVSAGTKVLSRRSLESYLFDDEILKKLAYQHDVPDLTDELLSHKKSAMERAHKERGRPLDDVKSSAGEIMENLKRKLPTIRQGGGTVKEFMRATLAPLVTAETTVFQDLKSDIF